MFGFELSCCFHDYALLSENVLFNPTCQRETETQMTRQRGDSIALLYDYVKLGLHVLVDEWLNGYN